MANYLVIFCSCLLITGAGQAQTDTVKKKADSLAVLSQLDQFVEAFSNLDFDRFRACFADDVTVFFPPSAMVPGRVDGKEKAMDVFKAFFRRVKEKKSQPPFLDIVPKKMQITLIQDVAIATFELDDTDSIGRRTILLRKIGGKFLIIHLHASKIDNPK